MFRDTTLLFSLLGTYGQICSNSFLLVTKESSDVAEITCNGLAHCTSSSWPHSSAVVATVKRLSTARRVRKRRLLWLLFEEDEFSEVLELSPEEEKEEEDRKRNVKFVLIKQSS